MDNNLPNDPPDQNGNNNPTPPSFGSNFDPHSNPVDPNNPYQSSPPPQTPLPDPPNIPEDSNSPKHATYSEVAQHKIRDSHGRFIHSENSADPQNSSTAPAATPISQTPPNPPPSPNPSSFLPPIIEVNQNTEPSDKKDPPLFGFFLTNPVTYLKRFLSRLLKRQAVTLRIPVLAILIIIVGAGSYGVGLKTGIDYALGKLFPNFSPILHRSISVQGTIQKSSKGYYLQANDKAKSLWMLKPASDNLNFADFVDLRVQIKGNLTPTPNLIEVSEVISFDTEDDTNSAANTKSPQSSQTSETIPVISNASSDISTSKSAGTTNPAVLPALYSGLTWEAPKNKTLTFTSGTRKIEQEVIYIESSQINTYPQDFISYYTQQLTNSGFKQTLNSQEPSSSSTTYSKGNLFLTFGIKNVYSGSGENKEIVGYKAFIEHN